jgi:hypothetical protein
VVLSLVVGVVHGVFRALKIDPRSKQDLAYEGPLFPLDDEGIALGEQGDLSQQKWLHCIALSQPQRQPHWTAIGLLQVQTGWL